MRAADKHLTPSELESLLFAATDSNVAVDNVTSQEAQQHLDRCDVCTAMAKKYANADSMLRNAAWRNKPLSGPPGDNCPPEEIWSRVAAEAIYDAAASQYISHAAQCDWCGRLLRESMEDLSEDMTAEEQAEFDKLPSAGTAWQHELAKKLAAGNRVTAAPATVRKTPARTKERFVWWPRIAFSTASFAVVVAAGWLVWHRFNPDPNKLLAQAYTEHRTMELRIAGAEYGAVRVERGGGSRDLPASFHKAEEIIISESARHIEDPDWLQIQARAALLEWDYDRAYGMLYKALQLKPDDPALLQDDAIALYERAKKGGKQSTSDYGQAANNLGKILKKNPDDPVALFNRSIIYEELRLPSQAVADCEHYLQIDSTGPWADEVRTRLKRLQKLTKTHADALAQPLADPVMFAGLANDPATIAQLDERIEDYQNLAVTKWLPNAFSPQIEPAQRAQISAALKLLGELLHAHHGDQWLNDLLASANDSPAFVSALVSLRESVIESVAGDAAGAYEEAGKAARLFTVAQNLAGTARSQGEQIYALRNSQNGNVCLSEAKSLSKKLAGRSYPWIQGRLDIDMASCFLMVGEFDRARAHISIVEKTSRSEGYPTLELRSIGIAAAIETDEGNLVEAWARDQYGLSKYWRKDFSPARRAQQFYDDLTYLAENTNQLNLAVAFAQESVRMISLSGDRKLEALARQHLAKIALRDGSLVLAAEQLAKSSDMLGALPHPEGLRSDRLYAQIGLADIELQQGRLDQADKRLSSLRGEVGAIASFTVPRAFYITYGQLLVRQQKISEAETEYRQAIEIADASLEKLESPSKRYFWTQENSGLYRSLVELELKKGNAPAALAIWEWYRAALFGQPSLPSRSLQAFLTSDGLRPLILSLRNQTVVSYFLRPEGLEIWLFDERGIESKFVALNPAHLAKLVSDFSEMCADRESSLDHLKSKGRDLYELLLGPVEDQLALGRVIVVEPDEVIGDLPFTALVTRDGRYFGEVYSSVLSSGVANERGLRPAAPLSKNAHALVVASTANFVGADTSLTPINVVDEAKKVAELFPNSKLLQDQNASIQDMEDSLPKAESVHFIGHAISTVNQEGLVMLAKRSELDTKLWGADEVREDLFLHSKLVVLSACSTGKNYRGRREIHGQLVRSLLLAGVPNIVGSRWNIDSNMTTHFMDLFYAALTSGKSVPLSIQSAEAGLRSDQKTRHPYFWAAFAVFGRAY